MSDQTSPTTFPDRVVLTLKLDDGSIRDWCVSAMPGVDNEEMLKAHVAKHVPGATLQSFRWLGDSDQQEAANG